MSGTVTVRKEVEVELEVGTDDLDIEFDEAFPRLAWSIDQLQRVVGFVHEREHHGWPFEFCGDPLCKAMQQVIDNE